MTKSPRRLREQVRDTVGEQVRDLPLHAVRLAMFGVGRALLLSDRVTRDYKEITEGGGVKPVIGRLREDVQTTAEKVVGRVVERVRGDEPRPRPEPARGSGGGPAAARPAAEEISVGKPGASTAHTPKHARPGPSKPPKPAKPGALGRHHARTAEESGPVARPAPKPVPPEPEPEPAPQARPAPNPKPADAKPAEPKAEERKAAEPKAEKAAEPKADKAAEAKADKAAEAKADKAGKAAFEPKPETKPAAPAEAEHLAADLPVPDYDSASLPQLRARLRGLTVDQVKLLREYESKHAGREDVIRMYERRIAKLNGNT
ncbi:hypothetical protein [Actinomadura madurae]|uniref:hypothetical protein n=1 Tax=Actinomadura madurae TaxID=1993 RepID=UPI0020D25AB2|nr:hypothetical protein [Actinomadura madurae]MCP9950227.1 hypothetical protein [Actinomadura madurae]MCP9979466.1 hypothetical protein [Actinomadura madurae]